MCHNFLPQSFCLVNELCVHIRQKGKVARVDVKSGEGLSVSSCGWNAPPNMETELAPANIPFWAHAVKYFRRA